MRAAYSKVEKQFLSSEIFTDSFMRGERRKLDGTAEHWHCERAQDAIAQQMTYAILIAHGEFDSDFRETWDEWEWAKFHTMSELMNARPFLLRATANRMAQKFTLPEHVVSATVMPYPSMFLCYELDDLIVPKGNLRREFADVHDMLLYQAPPPANDHLVMATFGSTQEGGVMMAAQVMPLFGLRFPEPPTDKATHLLQLLNFMQSKIAVIRPDKVPRATRRREKANALAQADVGIIELREYENAQRQHGPTDDSHELEHQWRWMVRGHYRAQWYPTEKAHHLKWIEPYVKGPEYRPLRPSVYDVCR